MYPKETTTKNNINDQLVNESCLDCYSKCGQKQQLFVQQTQWDKYQEY